MKGHCLDQVRYQVRLYSTHFFKPNGELEEGEVARSTNVAKLPKLIVADG